MDRNEGFYLGDICMYQPRGRGKDGKPRPDPFEVRIVGFRGISWAITQGIHDNKRRDVPLKLLTRIAANVR